MRASSLATPAAASKSGFALSASSGLIVGFNVCFDLARIAMKWSEGEKNEWSLRLLENPDGTNNPLYPPVLIDPIDSKKAFISFGYQWIPENGKAKASQINDAR